MVKRCLIIICFVALTGFARSQDIRTDSVSLLTEELAMDTSIDYDELLNDLDLFLDSILSPRSYFLMSLSVNQGYFNFTDRNNTQVALIKKFVWSPTLGYYDKSGFGLTLSSYSVRDNAKRYVYQFYISPSYDYLKDRNLAAGVSYIRYFTRTTVPFYTSPLQNEFNGYFLWRKSWLQPGIATSYGWGSRTEYTKIERTYKRIVATAVNTRGSLVDVDTITILRRNRESIVDFSLGASLRHDFYWLDIFSDKDHIRFSPMLTLYGGTQKFGFNQATSVYGNPRSISFNNRNISLQQKFQLLSMSLYLRSEYSVGKFFIQPQVLLDYYFPGEDNKLTTLFSVNTGFIF